MSVELYNQHAAISDLQQTEEELVDQHKLMNEFLAKFLPESRELYSMTNYVDYDQDGKWNAIFFFLQVFGTLIVSLGYFFLIYFGRLSHKKNKIQNDARIKDCRQTKIRLKQPNFEKKNNFNFHLSFLIMQQQSPLFAQKC
jgi:hypothetical protein